MRVIRQTLNVSVIIILYRSLAKLLKNKPNLFIENLILLNSLIIVNTIQKKYKK